MPGDRPMRCTLCDPHGRGVMPDAVCILDHDQHRVPAEKPSTRDALVRAFLSAEVVRTEHRAWDTPVLAEAERMADAALTVLPIPADDTAAPDAPLRCPRCGGEVEVEVEYLGYYSDTNVLGMECTGSTLPVTRDACGARWTPDGDPR